MARTQEQVWCNTCQTWHNCESWEAAAELNNWGCSLDFNRTRSVDVSVDEAEAKKMVKEQCCLCGRVVEYMPVEGNGTTFVKVYNPTQGAVGWACTTCVGENKGMWYSVGYGAWITDISF